MGHVSACDRDVDVCHPSCRGNFNKTTSCTWPRTSRHARLVQVASDTADILNHSFFLPRSLHMIFTCDIYIPLLLTPPSCVYRFLWERTVSIILYTFNSPFLFTPFISLEGLYHGQSEPEVWRDLYLSTLPVCVYTHTYIYIYIFFSRLEICEC